jgi:hypothetical protein
MFAGHKTTDKRLEIFFLLTQYPKYSSHRLQHYVDFDV